MHLRAPFNSFCRTALSFGFCAELVSVTGVAILNEPLLEIALEVADKPRPQADPWGPDALPPPFPQGRCFYAKRLPGTIISVQLIAVDEVGFGHVCLYSVYSLEASQRTHISRFSHSGAGAEVGGKRTPPRGWVISLVFS